MKIEDITIPWARERFPGLYFKHTHHAQEFFTLQAMRKTYEDREYLSLFYILAALNKDVRPYMKGKDGLVRAPQLKRDIGAWSSGERAMAKLALNLWNPAYKADVFDTFYNLDEGNRKVCLCAIGFRFATPRPVEFTKANARCQDCGAEAMISPSCACHFIKRSKNIAPVEE
jgi:hypothetical protein